MALTSAQILRLRIQDQPTLADTTLAGDGTATAFLLPSNHRNVTSGSAFVPGPGGTGWSGTGAAFDPSGQVAFADVISANSAYRLTYVRSTFADAEIDQFLADGGSIRGGAIEAVQTLMFDGLKRARWSSPDGTSYDDTAAMKLLNDLYAALKTEQADEAVSFGGVASWSVNQADY